MQILHLKMLFTRLSLGELLESLWYWEKGNELSGPSADFCQQVQSAQTEKVLGLFLIVQTDSACINNSVQANSLSMEFFAFA